MDLSIIIVSYKCKEKLKVTLDAVYASKVNFEYEIIVVDNESGDGTVEMVEREYVPLSSSRMRGPSSPTSEQQPSIGYEPDLDSRLRGNDRTGYENDTAQLGRLLLIKNTNEGFSKGNNRGLKVSKGAYKLLLNPDTKVAPNTLQVMMDFMKSRPDVGIATCKLVKEDGGIDPACIRGLPDPANAFLRVTGLSLLFPKSKFTTGYNLTTENLDQDMELGSCSGAFMFISPKCCQEVGLLDEQFFMYGEDIDYCKRANDVGFKIWYYPKTTTVHYRGQSSRKNVKKTLYEFHRAMWLYYKKHLIQKYPFFLNWLIYIGIWTRYLLQLIKNWFRREAYVSK